MFLCTEGALDSAAGSSAKDIAVVNDQAQSTQSEAQKVASPTTEQVADSGQEGLQDGGPTVQVESTAESDKVEAEKIQEESQVEVADESEAKRSDNLDIDIDIDDPELNKAASVIQANFRTYLSKKADEGEQPETLVEPSDGGDVGNAEPSKEGEIPVEEATPQAETQREEPEGEENVVPEVTATQSACEEDVTQQDEGESEPQSLPNEEQQAEEAEEEAPKDTKPQTTELEDVSAAEPLPDESKEEDGSGQLELPQSQELSDSAVPEGGAVEENLEQTEPSGGDERKEDVTEVSSTT